MIEAAGDPLDNCWMSFASPWRTSRIEKPCVRFSGDMRVRFGQRFGRSTGMAAGELIGGRLPSGFQAN